MDMDPIDLLKIILLRLDNVTCDSCHRYEYVQRGCLRFGDTILCNGKHKELDSPACEQYISEQDLQNILSKPIN